MKVLVSVLLAVMENTQLMARMFAQLALLDALNVIMLVFVLLARPIIICQEAHAQLVPLVSTHLLNQLTQLHVSLVRMKIVSLVAQPTLPESVPFVKKQCSPLQAFAKAAQIPNVSLVLDLELANVPLAKPATT